MGGAVAQLVVRREKIPLLFLALSFFLISGCQKTPKEVHFQFEPLGIRVIGRLFGNGISLYKNSGKLILTYPPMGDDVLLIFKWKPNKRYIVKIGNKKFFIKTPNKRPIAKLEVTVPIGQIPQDFFIPYKLPKKDFTFIGKPGTYKIGILLENLKTKPLLFSIGHQKNKLVGEFTNFFKTYDLNFKEINQKKTIDIYLPQLKKRIKLCFLLKETNKKHYIKLISWRLPTDAFGIVEGTRLEDTIVLPSPLWFKISYLFGLKDVGFSRFDPIAFQALEIKNCLSTPLSLLIQADFLDEHTRRPVPGLYPKQFGPTGGTKKVITFLQLPANKTSLAVLPIYVAPNVAPGEYLIKVKIHPFGYPNISETFTKKMGILRGSSFITIFLFLIIIISISYWVFLAFNIKKWFLKFNLRALVLIALMGAVGFGLDFLGGMFSNILHALLGPFNILVGGLITEVCHYLILTSILCLIPRIGTVSLSGLITYLMSGIIFGGFGILDILFVGSRLAYQEGLLYLLGVTRKQDVEHHKFSLMLSLAIADSLMTATVLILYAVFYRLFYPTWYIILAVIIKGFFYTLIGSRIGLMFGTRLIKMER